MKSWGSDLAASGSQCQRSGQAAASTSSQGESSQIPVERQTWPSGQGWQASGEAQVDGVHGGIQTSVPQPALAHPSRAAPHTVPPLQSAVVVQVGYGQRGATAGRAPGDFDFRRLHTCDGAQSASDAHDVPSSRSVLCPQPTKSTPKSTQKRPSIAELQSIGHASVFGSSA